MKFFKGIYNYIASLSRGEEVLSDRRKFTYIFSAFAFVHTVSAVFFIILHNSLLITFNILSVLLYFGLISLARKKHYLMVSLISEIEVLLAVTLISFTYGSMLGYSLYCFAMIPTIFYITSTVKEMKHPAAYCYIFSFITLLVFFTIIVSEPFFTIPDVLSARPIFTLVVRLFNAAVAFFFTLVFSLLFVWEMKSNNSQLLRRNQQLVEVARKDPLTKLANRRSMMERLNLSMQSLKSDNHPFSVILCDIDHFKKVNDVYGHDCGDKVLVTVANMISSQLRDTDFVCRWGGEEILIVIDGRLQTAAAIAERMRGNIEATEVMHEGQPVKVTMTFGVAQAELSYRIEDLIQLADTRLYYGKEHGRNQVVSQDMKE
ncbi:MAG: GGDEF domain-containing protein [Lachnospiraceae bacterium]|nr:GGDEF domain-containing protein [Lachnospiraceae bacterium]